MSKGKDYSQLNRVNRDWSAVEIPPPDKFKDMSLNQLLDYGLELKSSTEDNEEDSLLDYTTALESAVLNISRQLIGAECSIMSAYSFLDTYAQEKMLAERASGIFVNGKNH